MRTACAVACALAAVASSACTGDLFHDTTWAGEAACPANAEPHDNACVVTNERGVFVRSEGDDGAAGTREAPVKTLAKAIEIAKTSNKSIFACNQTFAEAIIIPSGVAFYGGLDCAQDWRYGDSKTTIALAPPPEGKEAGGAETGIILDTSDVEADHAALKAAGVDVDDEVSRYGDPVPPMFWLRDPDRNSLIIVQPTS